MTNLHIAALYTYPIKSCAGIQHDQIELDARGLHHDRQWMVVDETGKFVTQREVSQMALIQPSMTDDELVLTAPEMSPFRVPLAQQGSVTREVVVWKDICQAVDMGDAAADWFSRVMNMPVRLVRIADDFVRPTSTEYTPIAGETGFSDGYPLLFISGGSLEDLNERLIARNKAPVPMNRFRPNIVIGGSEPYAEDTWQQVYIGDIPFDVVKPCGRCVTTTVDQAVGTSPDVREPLATLATYRRGANGGAMFGQNVIHRGCGLLRVGDAITVRE
jgi:uncharacterized protein YcbX